MFKSQSQHIIQIGIKAAKIAFKIYNLYNRSYLYNFFFESWVSKISNFKKKPSITNFSSIIYWLCKSLLLDKRYMVFKNNLFTNIKLLTVLKSLGINKCKTAKIGSGFFFMLLDIYIFKKKTIKIQKYILL